jgi:hypothetical protein
MAAMAASFAPTCGGFHWSSSQSMFVHLLMLEVWVPCSHLLWSTIPPLPSMWKEFLPRFLSLACCCKF